MSLPFPLNPEAIAALLTVSRKLGVPASWLFALIAFESKWNPKQTVSGGKTSAKGLIQFIDSTAKDLGYDNSQDLITKNPTIVQQLNGPVYDYLSKKMPFSSFEDLLASVFYPEARTYPNWSTPLPPKVQAVNPGIVSISDYSKLVKKRAAQYGVVIVGVDIGALALLVVGTTILIKIATT